MSETEGIPGVPFEVVPTTLHGQETLHVRGDLDIVTAPELATAVTAALAGSPETLSIDLTDTTFLDSSGARQLVLSARRAGAAGTTVQLVCPRRNTAVWLVIDLLELGQAVPVVDPTVPEADDATS